MRPYTILAIASALLALPSCGEDPELVKKHGEQQAEIAKLRGELSLIQERLKFLPVDQSADLEKATKEAEKLRTEKEKLAAEVAQLESEHKKIVSQYEDYQRKYSIR